MRVRIFQRKLVGLLCAGTLCTVHAGTFPAAVPSSEYTHAHALVDIDHGRRLNLFCLGQGSPTVIFEAGLGEDSITFRHVQRAVASFTRACAYDRAGFGFSDAAQRPSDARHIVDDLHQLIVHAPLITPVVLVGHSSGGLYESLYAATFPNDVAGLLYIDPAFVGQDDVITAHWSAAQKQAWKKEDVDDLAQARQCLAWAKQGDLLRPRRADCLDDPPNRDPIIHQALDRESNQAKEQAAYLSEMEQGVSPADGGLSPSAIEVRDARPHFGDMPLVVLTAGNQFQQYPAAQASTAKAAWMSGHDRIASLSTQGHNILVEHSSHDIQTDRPDIVVKYVKQIVTRIRKNPPAPGKNPSS
jgi:pimeloyl-ACP methyl ester carboxylesterase